MIMEQNSTVNGSGQRKSVLTRFNMITMFFIHFGVSMYIVAFGSVVNSELKFAGLATSVITFIIGFITLIELSRVAFAAFVDRKGIQMATPVFLFGALSLVLGNAILSLSPMQGAMLDLVALSLATLGASILPTVIDGIFAKSSLREDRKLAMSLQTGRLLGFAIGGISVAIFYGTFGHQAIFGINTFMLILVGMTGVISIYKVTTAISQSTVLMSKRPTFSLTRLRLDPRRWMTTTVHRDLALIFAFLTLFGLGFFAQDSILELFGIEVLEFDRSKIGRLTGVWGVATLLGVLVGGYLMTRFSDKTIVVSNLVMATIGLIGISLAGLINPDSVLNYLMFMVFLLGFGGGAVSTPSIARLINLSKKTTIPLTIMGIVGIASTLTRSFSAIIAGILVEMQGFQFVFMLEASFLILAALPYIHTSRWDHQAEEARTSKDNVVLSS